MRAVRFFLPLAVLAAACTDVPSSPSADTAPPVARAIAQGGEGVSFENFFFLPPLVKEGDASGIINRPGLPTRIEICVLTDETANEETTLGSDRACIEDGPVQVFEGDQIVSGLDKYQVNYDTDQGVLAGLYPDVITVEDELRVTAFLGEYELGSFDLDIQDPDGETPGFKRPGYYTFNWGETLPVSWIAGSDILCEIGTGRELENGGTVVQCTENLVSWVDGGVVKLDPQGGEPIMGVSIPAGSQTDGEVFVRVERVELEPGETCIPELDIPTPGPCMLISSIPETFEPTLQPVTFGLCDAGTPAELASLLVDGTATDPVDAVQERLQIFRKPESYPAQPIEALAEAELPGDFCPAGTTSTALADSRVLGSFARLLEPVKRLVTPQPLVAYDIGRGGEREELGEFSWYTWGLPCQLLPVQGDDVFGDERTVADPAPTVECVIPAAHGAETELARVKDVRVRFNVTAGVGGTVVPSSPEDTDPPVYPPFDVSGEAVPEFRDEGFFGYTSPDDGYFTAAWTFGDAGPNQLRASVYGGFGEEQTVISHTEGWTVAFDLASRTTGGTPVPSQGQTFFNATVCSPFTDSGFPDAPTYGAGTFGSAGDIDGVLGEEWGCAMQKAYTFEANVGGATPAEIYWMNDDQYLYLALKVEGQSGINGLRWDFTQAVDVDGEPVAALNNDAFAFDPGDPDVDGDETQSDEYLTEKCLNRSQSGCGERDDKADGYNHGFAAFSQDDASGTTIYELRKPLRGLVSGYPDDPDADQTVTTDLRDFLLCGGDELFWYGTLRTGNGAKGNTQFPQFRDWFKITIAGPGC